MFSKWWKFHVDPTEEILLKYRLKMLGMALKKLYRITLSIDILLRLMDFRSLMFWELITGLIPFLGNFNNGFTVYSCHAAFCHGLLITIFHNKNKTSYFFLQ